jgi:antitoxin (DNA-binding transcriptional repressor) of toxin-antitoxin stability system
MVNKISSAAVENLSIKCSEMVGISRFCKNPPRYMDRIMGSGDRIILVKNGVPIAAVVPLETIAVLESDDNANQEDRYHGTKQ